jgi:ABC-type transport system involved in multi-copper enzyme maturation permease subunit
MLAMPALLRWMSRLGPTNPIVVRLVQGASVRQRHLFLRSAYLAILIVALVTVLISFQAGATTSFRSLAANGAQAFEIVAYLQVGLICVLAPVFMAGALSQEGDSRTWEILLTTPLSSLQIVLGTLLGRLFFVLALLAASLPLFAITQYFGGVPGRSVLLSYAVAGAAAILVGAVAVTLAVYRIAGRRTVFVFYVSVVTYVAVTAVADRLIPTPWNGVTAVTPLNPFLALTALLSPTDYPTPDVVLLQGMGPLARLWFGSPVLAWVIGALGLSLALIVASTFAARSVGVRSSVPWYRRMFGLGARGSRTRPPRHVGENPVAWRESTARAATLAKMLARWGFIALGLAWAIGLIAATHGGGVSLETFRLVLLATVWTEIVVISLIAVNMSATAISREREDGTLDLLLTTPITPNQYLGGKLLGLGAFLAPLALVPIATLGLASAYVATGGLGRAGGVAIPTAFGAHTPVPVAAVLPEVGLAAPFVLAGFLGFCVIIGLQWSLKTRGAIGSVLSTVGVVGVTAGVVAVCGWQAAREIDVVGPALAALNPVTLIWAGLDPQRAFEKTVKEPSQLADARFGLAIGALAATVFYAVVVVAVRTSMVKTFDMTTRKLAGVR